MSVQAKILGYGGFPVRWCELGKCNLTPGQTNAIGSGLGPFFTVIGVPGGAIFQYGK